MSAAQGSFPRGFTWMALPVSQGPGPYPGLGLGPGPSTLPWCILGRSSPLTVRGGPSRTTDLPSPAKIMAKKKPISRAEWNNIMVKAQQPPVLSFNSVRMIRAAEIASAYFPETAIELERILARELEIVDEVLCQLDIDILNADPNYWLDVQR